VSLDRLVDCISVWGLVTFAEIVAQLRSFDEEPLDGQAPAIYVADPWSPASEAVVEWSGEKGGLPFNRKPLLYYLITVREALAFFGPGYDAQVGSGEVDAMCAKLGYHTTQKNAQRSSRLRRDIT
jgi:hypothetical protein